MKVLLLFLMATVVAGAALAKSPATQTWTGIMIDKACATDIQSKHLTADQTMDKVKAHTKKCTRMADCVKSGYGIWSDGKYIPFDKKGNAQVTAWLDKTGKTSNLTVSVTGTLKGSTIAVKSIKEI